MENNFHFNMAGPDRCRVFEGGNAQLIGNPIQDMNSENIVPLSRSMVKNPESPMDHFSCETVLNSNGFPDLLFGAEETVETSCSDPVVGTERLDLKAHHCSPPIHTVKEKFQHIATQTNVLPMEQSVASQKNKALPPRGGVAMHTVQMRKVVDTPMFQMPVTNDTANSFKIPTATTQPPFQKNAQISPVQTGQPQTFTQNIAEAEKLLIGCGISIRPGGTDGNLGVVHIRSMSVDEEADLVKTRKKPVNAFEQNEMVYGTQEALSDLVKYHGSRMFEKGVSGVYTDPKYGFLEMSLRSPEDNCGVGLSKMLGQGAFGTVELWNSHSFQFVKKKIHGDFWQNEVLITSQLNHPNIVKTHAFIINQGMPEIIMDYGGESLLSYSLRNDLGKDEKKIWEITYFTLEGLKYLHDNSIIHFDIKPENICIKEGPGGLDITIADFGSAKKIGDNTKPLGMTQEYMSPELCQQYILESPSCRKILTENPQLMFSEDFATLIDGKSDIFSLGLVIMFPYQKAHVMIKHITGGLCIYGATNKTEVALRKLRITIQLATNHDLVQNLIPTNVGQNMKDLILGLTRANPQHRFDADQALEWMRETSKKAELLNAKENLKVTVKSDAKVRLSRKVLQPRRPSRDSKRGFVDFKEKLDNHKGVDLEKISQSPESILHENDQLKNRVVKGWLKQGLIQKRKQMDTSLNISGKQIKMETSSETTSDCKIGSLTSENTGVWSPCNIPNFSMLE